MVSIVVNCSAPHYNLASHKLTDWLRANRDSVARYDGDPGLFSYEADTVYLSVVFSWHALVARDIALRLRDHAEIHVGGPGMFALGKWWHEQTGLDAHKGLDARFERQPGNYRMTFASRGCPVGCYFCIVPKLEGTDFTLDWDFTPAPMLCDNNLSALPVEFQEYIIRRYTDTGTRLMDANSGFEPRTFDAGTYQRWKPILRGPWRFALDEMRELDDVRRMMEILRTESAGRKQVYVLIGNEPMAACQERAQKVIEWGGEPYCQPLMPLNALSRQHVTVRHDWTAQRLRDFARFYNRHLWRNLQLHEYKPRKQEREPFAQEGL